MAQIFRFVILVPHRDIQGLLEKMGKELFSLGLLGAHSFPRAAPLLRVSKALSREELKDFARNIRELTKKNDGKITSAQHTYVNFTGALSFYGPQTDLYFDESIFPESLKGKILDLLSPPILCTAITGRKSAPKAPGESPGAAPMTAFSALSFRAGALANLSIRALASGEAGYSYEWKMGPLHWLPGNKVPGNKLPGK